MKQKILLFDIETAPNLALVWGHYEQNVLAYEREWYMMSFSAKWLDKKKMITKGLPDYKTYKKNPENDKELVKELWELFDEADIIIAHNGDKFDIKKANARFVNHKMLPPSPYKTIDTLKVARRYFSFNSNKLTDLGVHLGLGKKIDTGGFQLWRDCMAGKMTAWKKMLDYNKQDVVLLEKIYLELRNWMTNHPNLGLFVENNVCPNCANTQLQKRGFGYTRVSKYQRYQCVGDKGCGAWSRGKPIRTNVDVR